MEKGKLKIYFRIVTDSDGKFKRLKKNLGDLPPVLFEFSIFISLISGI